MSETHAGMKFDSLFINMNVLWYVRVFCTGNSSEFPVTKKDTARKERCPRKFLFKNHLRITPLSAPVRCQPQELSCLS